MEYGTRELDMFQIFVNQQEMHRCGTWSSVKAYMIANGLRFVFVTRGDKQWNVKRTLKGTMLKSEA